MAKIRQCLLIALSAWWMGQGMLAKHPVVREQLLSRENSGVETGRVGFDGLPWEKGAFETGTYRNLFAEMGYRQEDIDAKLKEVFDGVFFGPNKVYFEVGDSMAYITDIKNHDVRTEGMSYGMMIAVQFDRKDIFDRLWRWSKQYMQHQDGPWEGYFAWSCRTDGTRNAQGPASDGELYYVTSLIFASNRWGNDTGISYLAEAQRILNCSMQKTGRNKVSPFIHPEQKLITFTPANGAPGRGFLYTASSPEGPWTLHSRPPHFHDGSLFFDDDGRTYIFHGTGHLTELKPDLTDKLPGGIDQQIFERDADEQGLLEGSSVIKHNGKYYLLMISMDWSIPGRLRREVCYRADSITGPYEKRVILETEFEGYGGVGQGCIVEGKQGEWYGLIFQDRGGVGRVPCLMPCTWTDDGWPMLGDAEGKIPNDTSVPYASMEGICGSDAFDKPELSLYWQWNHNPIDKAWSLTECPGCLRLKTGRVVENLYLAPNTLTQRMRGPQCTGIALLHIGGMADGDVAGLAAFNGDSGVLSVEWENGVKRLVMSEQKSVFKEPEHGVARVEKEVLFSTELQQDDIYLRIDGDFTQDLAAFSYSLDGKEWVSVGRPVRMVFDYTRLFMGSKFALFNYATRQTGGYVDVESFEYR